MTSPANPGDYVTPGGSYVIPNAATPGLAAGDRNGVATHGVSVVQMQEQAWRARAAAAMAAAEELRRVHGVVSRTLTHNYFGAGCPEGDAVYDALCDVLKRDNSSWAGQLKSQIVQLEALARQCTAAATRLSATDATSATRLSPTAT